MTTVYLYNNSDDKRVVSKTLGTAVTVSAELYEASSVLTPRIRIDWFAGVASVNYMYIPDFERYYYISQITADPGGAVILTGAVDVLMSYAAAIKLCPAVVVRQSRKNQTGPARSTWIPDSQLPLSAGRTIKAVELEGSDLNIDTADMTSTNFVLNVAGGGAITGGANNGTV